MCHHLVSPPLVAPRASLFRNPKVVGRADLLVEYNIKFPGCRPSERRTVADKIVGGGFRIRSQRFDHWPCVAEVFSCDCHQFSTNLYHDLAIPRHPFASWRKIQTHDAARIIIIIFASSSDSVCAKTNLLILTREMVKTYKIANIKTCDANSTTPPGNRYTLLVLRYWHTLNDFLPIFN